VPARLEAEGYDDTAGQVARLAKLELNGDGGDPAATVTIPGGAIHMLAGGGFDPQAADRKRADRRAELESEIQRAQAKLANERFVERAPAEVVDAERAKLARLEEDLAAL
jgi:valyl-tRNA synthetase